jgi:hypothetical protein
MIDKFFHLPALILIILSLPMLLLLSAYSYYHEKDFFNELNEQITNPQKNLGKTVYLSYVKIAEVNDNEAVAKNRRGDTYLLFPVSNIIQGEYYSFIGKVSLNGKLEIIQQYHQTRWQLKHLLSLLSLLLVLYYIIKYIRFDKNSFLFYIINRKKNA